MSAGRIVRVLPHEAAIDKTFDYLVPPGLPGADLVSVGCVVRIELHGRRVGAWVVAVDVVPDATTVPRLKPITKVSSVGPPGEVLDLAQWAAWRWAGKWAQVLRFAGPVGVVRELPPRPGEHHVPDLLGDDEVAAMARAALRPGARVVRLPPACDPFPLVLEAARHAGRRGGVVVVPGAAAAVALARRLRRAGVNTALLPEEWAKAAAGGTVVVGARNAVWAPVVRPGVVVVLDEHDERHKEERAPTWHVRDVAIERARRAAVPCLLVSSMPTLEALAAVAGCISPSRALERGGWARLEIVDRATEEPGRSGLVSDRVVAVLRGTGRVGERVVCVLNRTGRAKLLACTACGDLACCERCGAALRQGSEPVLECPCCALVRPFLCASCGGGRLKNLRMGVTRAREEIEILAGRSVGEVTATTDTVPDTPVLVGTEAVLHRVEAADTVVFLDFDNELLAARYRAAEEALGMLARASRMVGGRNAGQRHGRVIVQTRLPEHTVVQAALLADPGRLQIEEQARRALLRFAPTCSLALVSGASAPQFASLLRSAGGEVSGDGPSLVRAETAAALADLFAATPRPPGRVRVDVDPLHLS